MEYSRPASRIEVMPGSSWLDPAPPAMAPLRTVGEAWEALTRSGAIEAETPAEAYFGLYTRSSHDVRDHSLTTEFENVPAYVFRTPELPSGPSSGPAGSHRPGERFVASTTVVVDASRLRVLQSFGRARRLPD